MKGEVETMGTTDERLPERVLEPALASSVESELVPVDEALGMPVCPTLGTFEVAGWLEMARSTTFRSEIVLGGSTTFCD